MIMVCVQGMQYAEVSEKLNIPIVRKSIVTACPIKQGERFSEKNLCV